MPTKINAGQQIQPGTITRALLNTTTTGSAIISKIIAGSGITLSSTGVDAGTGDVTITAPSTLKRTPVADANYSCVSSDNVVCYTSITAARTVTLPAASSFKGSLFIVDESGSCNGSNKITIVTASSSDFVNGLASFAINTSYGFIQLESNGSNNWTIIGTNFYNRYGAIRQETFPSSGTTSIPVSGGYNVGFIDVYVNGIKLTNNDFTATDGANVVLNTATSSGDDVQIIGLATIALGYALAQNADATTGTANNLLMTPSTTTLAINNTIAKPATVTNVSNTAYTLSASDINTVINFTGSSANTLTVPKTLPAGFSCIVVQSGTGQVSVANDGTSVVNNAHNSLKFYGQYAVGSIIVSANSGGSSAVAIFSGDTA